MSIFLMGNGEWGLETGDSGMGTRESGVGNGDSGIENREPLADSRCGNQLSAIRLPLSEFAYYFFQMI